MNERNDGATKAEGLIGAIDGLSEWTGRALAWLTLLMVLVTTYVVVMRYVFDVGSIALQESVTYMHAMVFMLGAAYTLKREGHVRVDIVYRNYSPRARAWVNAVGALVLGLPLAVFIGWGAWDFVVNAWVIREISPDAGGLPWVYWLKSLIPLMAALLCLQLFADLLRQLLILMQRTCDEPEA